MDGYVREKNGERKRMGDEMLGDEIPSEIVDAGGKEMWR